MQDGGTRAVGSGFAGRLATRVAERESQIVLGLDPDPARLWPSALEAAPDGVAPAERAAAAIAAHCRALIDAAGPACVAAKPQLACFERLGAAGRRALGEVVGHARDAGLLIVADAKRGDIDVTAAAYAQALLTRTPTPWGDVDGLGADAMTVNPYLGADALEPFAGAAREAGAGLFVLVRTSNPGAADIQDLELAGGGALWERVAGLVGTLGDELDGGRPLSSIGAVMGSTRPEHLARARELLPRAPFLLPGIGAQGGRVDELAPVFAPGRAGGLVSASRSISRAHEARPAGPGGASRGRPPAEAARAEAERLRAAAWSLA